MRDDEFCDLFRRMDLRLERLDTKVENLEKGFADLRGEMRTHLLAIDARLDKVGNWVVSFWDATLAMLITAAFALTKW
jgi:hypothetical protein